MRRDDQERMLVEVQSRVVSNCVQASLRGGTPIDEILAESVYCELQRLEAESPSKTQREDLAFWQSVRKQLWRGGERAQQGVLEHVVEHYVQQIKGHFSEEVHTLATRLLPPALALLLNASSPKRLLSELPSLPHLDSAMVISGETEHLRRLSERGTVILAPTHVSNMDSIVLGYAIWRLGLPAFIYGAGLNLFSNPIIGFFMRNLGAYTVDRRNKDPLYKEILKEYATLTLEYGYDNLFFPGGTRSRSGALEKRLKLGLLGSSIPAYVHNLRRGAEKPRIFIVPATLSYQLVLEAETLIDDFLRDVGKSRYIITDDEFAKPQRLYTFISQLLALDSKIYLTISRGMDPFGNPVDDDGESLDAHGHVISPEQYVMQNGEAVTHAQRDSEHTRRVGERLMAAYARDNVVQSTHVLARAAFALLRHHNANMDLMRLIRAGGRVEDFSLFEVYQFTNLLIAALRRMASQQQIRLSPILETGDAEEIIADGMRHFATYHRTPAVLRKGDRLFVGHRSLLFYYQNRLEGYAWGDGLLAMPPALAADHRALGKCA